MREKVSASSRPITSPVSWAVLGLVMERPSYGYELIQRLGRRYTGVLQPTPSHVYQALNALEKAGLIEPVDARKARGSDQACRQPKIPYRATERGRVAFQTWMTDLMYGDPQHVDLLLRIAASPGAGMDSLEQLRVLIESYEAMCLAEARRLPEETSDAPASSVGELAERLVLGARREMLDSRYRWIHTANRELDAFVRGAREDRDEPARP